MVANSLDASHESVSLGTSFSEYSPNSTRTAYTTKRVNWPNLPGYYPRMLSIYGLTNRYQCYLIIGNGAVEGGVRGFRCSTLRFSGEQNPLTSSPGILTAMMQEIDG